MKKCFVLFVKIIVEIKSYTNDNNLYWYINQIETYFLFDLFFYKDIEWCKTTQTLTITKSLIVNLKTLLVKMVWRIRKPLMPMSMQLGCWKQTEDPRVMKLYKLTN